MYAPFPAAKLLYDARVPGQSLAGLPDTVMPANLDQAYAIQFALCELLMPTQGPVQGYKVGCTNAKARSLLGIDGHIQIATGTTNGDGLATGVEVGLVIGTRCNGNDVAID